MTRMSSLTLIYYRFFYENFLSIYTDYNDVSLFLDAPKDSVIDCSSNCRHICLIFCMEKVYYLTPVCT